MSSHQEDFFISEFEPLLRLFQTMINEREEDIKQKWINLASLKYNLRYCLVCLEYKLRSVEPSPERRIVFEEFLKLKDVLWQTVGAIHGSITSVPYKVKLYDKVLVHI